MTDNFVEMEILYDDIRTTIERAHGFAQGGRPVEFRFNDIMVRVSEETNLDWLLRDYYTARTLGWSTIGPAPQEEYDDQLKRELEVKRAQLALQGAEKQLQFAQESVALARQRLATLGAEA
jgi:hypothetical protein